jgi:hypothetical protein
MMQLKVKTYSMNEQSWDHGASFCGQSTNHPINQPTQLAYVRGLDLVAFFLSLSFFCAKVKERVRVPDTTKMGGWMGTLGRTVESQQQTCRLNKRRLSSVSRPKKKKKKTQRRCGRWT